MTPEESPVRLLVVNGSAETRVLLQRNLGARGDRVAVAGDVPQAEVETTPIRCVLERAGEKTRAAEIPGNDRKTLRGEISRS